ncbi:hypothetical protein Tco_0257921, partial [Tanacetum coccineum]
MFVQFTIVDTHPVLAIELTTLASQTVLIDKELVLQVQHQGLSQFKIRLVEQVEVMASLLERHSENPGRSARLQVASPPTCLPSSLLKPVP